MMNIMERSILLIEPLKWVPRQSIPTVIINALHDRDSAEAHGLADREAGEHKGDGGAGCVEEECFGEGVVEGAEGVGDVDLGLGEED